MPLILMNCVSEYPPCYEDINLGVIRIMKERYPEAVVGHSDHTPDVYTCLAAVALGARVIEKHVILDKNQPGPDQSVSIDFLELKDLIKGVRKIEKALGSCKKVHKKEEEIRIWAFRSLVTVKNIPADQIITKDMIWSKRPGTGIPARFINKVIGRKAKKDIPINTLLSWEDLEGENL